MGGGPEVMYSIHLLPPAQGRCQGETSPAPADKGLRELDQGSLAARGHVLIIRSGEGKGAMIWGADCWVVSLTASY